MADLTGGAFQATDPQFPSKGPHHSSFYPFCLSGQRERTGGCSLKRDFETHPFVAFCHYFCFELVNFSLAAAVRLARSWEEKRNIVKMFY